MDHTCIRRAVPEDAETLARLHLECWRETYAHLLSPGFMASQGVEGRLALWRRFLGGPDGAACGLGTLQPHHVPRSGP